MDTNEITCCLKSLLRNSKVKCFYVIGRDELSSIDLSLLPVAIVVNTDDLVGGSGGIHWCGFYVEKFRGRIIGHFMDSYHNPVYSYNFNPPFQVYYTNKKVLQSDNTKVCGIWAMAWIYHLSRGKTTKSFEARFSGNLALNDKRILLQYKKYLKKEKSGISCCSRAINKL
jgi:hypothetical protein